MYMRTIRFMVVTMVFILITGFGITGTVMSQEKGRNQIDAKHWRVMENEYISGIRQELEEQGYENVGITMTKITDGDAPAEYMVQIHHKRLNWLTEGEKNCLVARFAEVDFPMEECRFSFCFLENND